MINKKSKAWIEAAKKIAANSSEEITCPNCGHEFLKIEKVPWPNFEKMDIYMTCENCHTRNVLTISMRHSG